MRQTLLLCTLQFILLFSASSQNKTFTVSGKINLSNNHPASSATVLLLSLKDSNLVKTEISSDQGFYKFSNAEAGNYFLSVTYTGYVKYMSKSFVVTDSSSMPDIILYPDSAALGNVILTARKPLIQQQFDKLIFNVNGNITAAGNSALEMLEKAPGVFVDHSGNISLGGRTGVLILIDGKRTHLPATDLAAYLRGLPASTIERIDLISNPSSQFEAAGTSGIIDIRLKKDNRYGYNGTISLAFLHGSAASANGSLNFNFRAKKINLYTLLSKTYDNVEGIQKSERTFFRDEMVFNGSVNSDNTRKFKFNSNNLRIGADYFAGKKTIIGLMATKAFNKVIADYNTRLNNYYQVADSFNYSVDRSINMTNRTNSSMNFNIKHSIDSAGREWNFDIDYVKFKSNDEVDLTANFYNKNNVTYLPYYKLLGDLGGKMDVFAGQFDLQLPKTFTGNLQLGLRSSLVRSDNDLVFLNYSSGTAMPDMGKTNRFLYRENINAAYIMFQKRKDRISIQTGLRFENTNGKGQQIRTNQVVTRSYYQLFPNLFLAYDVAKNYTVGISLARRIDRPSYNQLNPFRFYGNPFGYTEGDPFLKPQLSFVAELTNSFFTKYILRLSYSSTSDFIGLVWGTDISDPRISAQRYVNMNKAKFYRMTMTIPVTFKNILTSFNNIIGSYSIYKGETFNTTLNRSLPSFSISSNNTIRISQKLNFELNAWYRTAVLASAGSQRFDPAANVTAGVGKRIFSGKGNLRINVSDIFKTNIGHGLTTLNNYRIYVRQWNETRRVTLSLNYNFGKSQVAAARNRTTSADEERRRAGN